MTGWFHCSSFPSRFNPVAFGQKIGCDKESEIGRSLRTKRTLDGSEIDNGHGGCAGTERETFKSQGKMKKDCQFQKKTSKAVVKNRDCL